MYKITGLEDIHQVPAKVRQMYMAVRSEERRVGKECRL